MSSQYKICSSFSNASKNNINKQKSSTNKKNIIKWLFEMKYEERMKTFSLMNKDICHNIIRMYDKFNASSRMKFKINLKDRKPGFTHKEIDEAISESYKLTQILFLKEVRFYSVQESNDAMTLSKNALENQTLLCHYFDELSHQKFLSEIGIVTYDQKQGMYSCTTPQWIDDKEYYTLSQIIIGYFENVLNIKYNLTKKKKDDINDALDNFFDKRNTIINYIKNSAYNENLYDIIDLKTIVADVINDKQLINDEERNITCKRFICGLYRPLKLFEAPCEYSVNSYFYKYKEKLMEKNDILVDDLMFMRLEGQSIIDSHINERIIESLFSYADKKRIDNLLEEIQGEGFLSNTKKKNKKKKKKNKKNDDENNNNNDNVSNNSNNNEANNSSKNISKFNDDDSNKKKSINNSEDEEKEKEKEENNNNINHINHINSSDNFNNINLLNDIEEKETKEEEDQQINEDLEPKENNIINSIASSTNTETNKQRNLLEEEEEEKNKEQTQDNELIKKNNAFNSINNNINDNKINSINNNNKIVNHNNNNTEEDEEDNDNENENEINKNLYMPKNKKKNKRKKKKKTYSLTKAELNNIHNSFYNENNNFNNKQSQLKTNSIPMKDSNTKDKNEQLHNLILNFEKKIYKKILSLHEIKYNAIILLCQKIKEYFKCNISVFIYGSYSTGMELEESDIDISVELQPSSEEANENINKPIPDLIKDLNNYLSNFPEFKSLFPIVNTKIPILKMIINQNNNIQTKIDLTFFLKTTRTTISFYNSTLKKYPQIKPLTLLIKYLVKKNKLDSVFDGGFSSHSIFIMVTANVKALLKNKNSLNLGDLLNSFLHFYGKIFNYTNTTIDLMNKNDPYIITPFSNVPIFIDPITKTNVSKSSYQHEDFKKLLSDTYNTLVQGENNLNKTFEDIFS